MKNTKKNMIASTSVKVFSFGCFHRCINCDSTLLIYISGEMTRSPNSTNVSIFGEFVIIYVCILI